jgi:tetratricopeptide (TPR) repeat protein
MEGKLESALTIFNKNLEVDDENIESRYFKAHCINNISSPIETLKIFLEVEKRSPNYEDTRFYINHIREDLLSTGLGQYNSRLSNYVNYRQYRKAIECLDELILIQPLNSGLYTSKGKSLAELGRYSQALEAFDEAILLSPDNAVVYFYKGKVLSELNDIESVIECFEGYYVRI